MKSNKLLALIISLMILFSFAACDKKSDAKETTKHTTSSSTTKKSSTTKATSTTATPTTASTTTTKKATVTTTKKVAATSAPTTTTAATTSTPLPSFSITVAGKTISNNDVKYLTVYEYYVEATNSNGTLLKNTYKGYKLSDILRIAGVTIYSNGISIKTTDNYPATYTKTQIDDAKTILAITKNGSCNEDCPVLAPCSEATANNYVKMVSSITVL